MTGPRARPGRRARSLEGMGAGVSGRARRVLAVLAIALGVLAMHGLAGGHHGAVPALPSLTAAVTADGQHATDAAHPADHAAHDVLAVAAVVSPLHGLGDGCDGDCSEHPSGLLLLCMAVLLAAAGAVALGLGRRTWRTVPSTGPPLAGRLRRTAPPRRLDLVAELCVSRT